MAKVGSMVHMSADINDGLMAIVTPAQDFAVRVSLSRDLALAAISWGVSDPDTSQYVPGLESGKGIRVGYNQAGDVVAVEVLTDEVDTFRNLVYRLEEDRGDACAAGRWVDHDAQAQAS